MTPTTEELLKRYQDADPRAFDLLYRRVSPVLFQFLLARLGSRADAEEALQDAFFRIHRHILKYDPARSAMGWMMTIARNAMLDVVAKRRGHATLAEDVAAPDARTEAKQIARVELERLLAKITPEERALVAARLVDDTSFDDIGAAAGLSAATVRQRLSRILRKLR